MKNITRFTSLVLVLSVLQSVIAVSYSHADHNKNVQACMAQPHSTDCLDKLDKLDREEQKARIGIIIVTAAAALGALMVFSVKPLNGMIVIPKNFFHTSQPEATLDNKAGEQKGLFALGSEIDDNVKTVFSSDRYGSHHETIERPASAVAI